jgi:hypothetical protein
LNNINPIIHVTKKTISQKMKFLKNTKKLL